MGQRLQHLEELIRKHPIPVALAGAGAVVLYVRHKAAGASASLPFVTPANLSTPGAAGIDSLGSTAGGVSTGGGSSDTSALDSALNQISQQLSGLGTLVGNVAAGQGSTPPPTAGAPPPSYYQAAEYAAGYTPQVQLQGAAVSAAQSAGQTLSANCNKVTSCKGFFSCINPFRQIPALLGCAGQAVLTVGTGVAATALPAVQTGLSSVANYAPSLLGGIGIPGLPKAAPTTPSYAGIGYSPYAGYPTPYTPPIAPYSPYPPPASVPYYPGVQPQAPKVIPIAGGQYA